MTTTPALASLEEFLRGLLAPPTAEQWHARENRAKRARHELAEHRGMCLTLAGAAMPESASTYDRIAAADYLENGYHSEPEEVPACSCQNEQASHPLGDEAYCEARQ